MLLAQKTTSAAEVANAAVLKLSSGYMVNFKITTALRNNSHLKEVSR